MATHLVSSTSAALGGVVRAPACGALEALDAGQRDQATPARRPTGSWSTMRRERRPQHEERAGQVDALRRGPTRRGRAGAGRRRRPRPRRGRRRSWTLSPFFWRCHLQYRL